MNTTAPVRPQGGPPSDPRGVAVGDAPLIEDGIIFDARRRARRRRAGFVIVASAIAVAAGAFALVGGPFGGAGEAPRSRGDQSTWLPGPSADAEVVAKWSKLHVGWVYVFDDGRVLTSPDGTGILEQRLSPLGLDLVRSGALDLRDLVLYGQSAVAATVWSDPAPEYFRPAEYALCYLDLRPDPDHPADFSEIQQRLPESLQAILRRSTLQSFTDDFDADGMDGEHSAPGPGVDCFVLGPEQARAVWAQTHSQDGSSDDDGALRGNDYTFGAVTATDGAELVVIAIPILPHGGWVLLGG